MSEKKKAKSKKNKKNRAPKGPRAPKAQAPRKSGKGPKRPPPREESALPYGGRRALVNHGGEIQSWGDEALARPLIEAFESLDGADADTLTHGFHAYPARMHASLAYHLIHAFTRTGGAVLDPFCGSGTVPLEAMVAGRAAVGTDLNPLALRIAEVKCDLRSHSSRQRFERTLRGIAVRSEERVRARVDARAPIPPSEARWYRGHTLKELAGLREEILEVSDERDRRALEVLLSAILVKFSHQQADTTVAPVEKRLRKGLPTEFFLRKGQELIGRWESTFEEAPRDAAPPSLKEIDVRDLPGAAPRGYKADLILTSPPYGGTYDYVDHHARRYLWLGLDASKLERLEIGARRNLSEPGSEPQWDREVHEMLDAMAAVLHPQGVIVLLVGDGQVAGRRLLADKQLAALAPMHGLKATAAASQPRPDWTGGGERREHLVALIRA